MDNLGPAVQVQGANLSRKRGIGAFVLALLILAGVGGMYYYKYVLTKSSLGQSGTKESPPAGILYLTVGVGAPNPSAQGSYSYDLGSQTRGPILLLSGMEEYYPSLTGDFVAAMFQNNKTEDKATIQVVERRAEKSIFSQAIADVRVDSISLSTDRKTVAYTTIPLSVTPVEALRPEMWQLHVFSVNGKQSALVHGTTPAFSSDSKHLYYLAKDGVYSMNLPLTKDSKGEKMWSINVQDLPASFMRLVGAKDAPVFALSNPQASRGKGSVRVFALDLDESFKETKVISESASNVTLSPDGKFVAVQIQNENGSVLPGAGRIDIYSVATGQVVKTLPLSNFVSQLRLVDWAHADN